MRCYIKMRNYTDDSAEYEVREQEYIWLSSAGQYPVHLLVISMYICTSQSLFSHSYVVNE
jgi:hypothetical protein